MTTYLPRRDHIHKCRQCGISWACADDSCESPESLECYRCGYYRDRREWPQRNGDLPQVKPLLKLERNG